MTLIKISLRNLKKSMHNYIIYFATLILGVAIFYVFNALGDQTVMMNLSETARELLGFLDEVMSVVSVFVACVLGFLVVYANTFLMKRRKKEFGIYMLLGMGKGKISAILITETVLIGLISLVVGLLLGIVCSQGMSIFVANLFEADMTHFQFRVERVAILKTLEYFLIMYVIVVVLDVFVVGKSKLITLIQSGKKSQKNYAKNPVLCLIVFALAAVLLGTAYYKVTAEAQTIREFSDLAVQIGKGIIGTFLLFWSISGFFLFFIRGNRKFYHKGLNVFTTKELSSRINTTVFSGGIICLLLFFTICILSSAVSIKRSLDDNMRKLVPVDLQFSILMDNEGADEVSVEQLLEERKYPMEQIKDCTEYSVYEGEAVTMNKIFPEGIAGEENMYDTWYECMKLSDYNRAMEAFGRKPLTIEGNTYVMVANYPDIMTFYNQSLPDASPVVLGGVEYKPYDHCVDGFITLSETASNAGIVVFPDDVDFSDMEWVDKYMSANYVNQDRQARRDADKILDTLNFDFEVEELPEGYMGSGSTVEKDGVTKTYISMNCQMKNRLYDTSVGFSAMAVFVGTYLGVIFLISSGAILALKELSEATDNKKKYAILRKIGVEEKQIRRSLLAQCGVFFGLPLAIGILHSVFGMKTAKLILNIFGKAGMLSSVMIAAVIILLIYGVYFLITYTCCRKIISER